MNLIKLILLLSVTAITTANSVAMPMTSNNQEVRFGRFSVNIPKFSSVVANAKYLGVGVAFHNEAITASKFKENQDTQAHKYKNTKMNIDQDTIDLWKGGGVDPAEKYGSNQLIKYTFDPANKESFVAYREKDDSPAMIARLSRLGRTGITTFEITNRTASGINDAENDIRKVADVFQFSAADAAISPHAFCVKEGCFNDGVRSTSNEYVALSSTLGGHQDAELSVETTLKKSHSQSFNDIEKNADSEIQLLKDAGGQVTVLKRGKRTFVGQTGYEIAVKVDAPGHKTIFIFTWASTGTTGDPLKPIIQFGLRIDPNAYHGVSTFSSPQEVEEFWESLANSLRVR